MIEYDLIASNVKHRTNFLRLLLFLFCFISIILLISYFLSWFFFSHHFIVKRFTSCLVYEELFASPCT